MKKEYFKAVVYFFITLWLGFFGIHKFMKKDFKMGLIYLFTFGIFGIGWIIDVVKAIINMIKIYQKANSTIIDKTSTTNSNVNNVIGSTNNIIKKEKEVVEKFRQKKIDFSPLIDDYYVKYEYERNVAGVEFRNLDFSLLKNSSVSFELDKENEHDPEAIKIIQKDILIGYVYKTDETIREMIHNYIEKDNWIITGWLKTIDEEQQKLTYQIAFYKQLDENRNECVLDTKATLTKTSKKVEDYETSRQDSLSYLSEDDFVSLEESYETDNLVVINDMGDELGELTESVSEKLSEYINNDEYFIICKVLEITESDSGKYGAKISIKVYEK